MHGGAYMLYYSIKKEPEWERAKRATLTHPAGSLEHDCVSCHCAARIYIHVAHLFYKLGVYIVVMLEDLDKPCLGDSVECFFQIYEAKG